ncbi:MAG TPA: carboxymuconolactone decarboxylase family protein [Thermoleophilaceae bacterium]|nr:carboxymuconolactone decarboxylase family protein [Thermoleophilaceae bacterium]
MAKKAKESRFQLHDELTAPERSLPVLKGALSTGGQVSNMLGLLAGAPSVLRAYARFRSELRQGALPLKTQQRVALAVAQHEGSEYVLAMLQRTARDAGLGLDEIALAREFDSADEREAVLLAFVKALLDEPDAVPLHLVEEAREADWSDEQLLETTAHVSLGLFHALFTRGGNLPIDGSAELGRVLRAA